MTEEEEGREGGERGGVGVRPAFTAHVSASVLQVSVYPVLSESIYELMRKVVIVGTGSEFCKKLNVI